MSLESILVEAAVEAPSPELPAAAGADMSIDEEKKDDVLNVSESWQRNHTLSKKEDQKLLDTGELLQERLKGRGYVVVEILNFFHDKEEDRAAKYKVMVREGDRVPALKAKISSLIEADDWTHLQLLCDGTPLPDDADVVKALRKLSKGPKWPTPYFGVVWVCPK
ncbi:hypothetical protein TrRE_jg20 [Triparma retinervis]|uniref:Uncharacterized protein n=1 Tax=Triparma retinervis TaxID=2557542 RepID=A0A9W6ZS20_9STRA|nr:hypothetical protein TrRE_jg20 [Triparma retinervis]